MVGQTEWYPGDDNQIIRSKNSFIDSFIVEK